MRASYDSVYWKKYYQANRERLLEKAKNYRKKRPEIRLGWGQNNPLKLRAYNLKRYYGLTLERVNQMLAKQSGKCALCDRAFKTTPCVDHCHKTGVVRGLLCHGCNVGLGKIEKVGLARIENYLNIRPVEIPVIGPAAHSVTARKDEQLFPERG